MSHSLFLTIFVIGAILSSLITEGLKKAFKHISSNFLALVSAVFVEVIGCIFTYEQLGLSLTPATIACFILEAVLIWVGSMVGYDKVLQTLRQIGGTDGNKGSDMQLHKGDSTGRPAGL